MMKYAKYGALGLGALVFLFFMMRAIKKREKDSFGRAQVALRAGVPAPAGRARGLGPPTRSPTLQPHVGIARRQIEELVQRDPDLVAQHLRAWMAEE